MAPAVQSDSMLGHLDELVPLDDGTPCHLRVVQVGKSTFKLYLCPVAQKYIKSEDITTWPTVWTCPIQFMAHVKNVLLTSYKEEKGMQKSYIQVLNEISKIGFDKFISLDETRLILKASNATGHCVTMDLNRIGDDIVTEYQKLCKEFAENHTFKELISELRLMYYVSKDTKTDSVYVYVSEGNSLLLEIRDGVISCSNQGTITTFETIDQLKAYLNMIGAAKRTDSIDKHNCGICMSIDDDNLPDQGCTMCQRSFHSSCLLDWLQNSNQSKEAFGYISGPCPWEDCTNMLNIKQ